jgi:acyl-CoA reductase-like NAD-dependent aldehyde dehydrogenase
MAMHIVESDRKRRTARTAETAFTTCLASRLRDCRAAQVRWSQTPLQHRLRLVRRIRHEIAAQAEQLSASVGYPQRNGPVETLAGELIPLADACKFLEAEAKRILAPRRVSNRRRPLWLGRVSVVLQRDPLGTVLVVGASNYPLFLPGVQALQAIVAGNSVLVKPGHGASAAAAALAKTFISAGLDPSLVQVLPEDVASVAAAVNAGVDKVVLTGSAETGCRVYSLLAESLTPATMELSGCDAVFVLASADLNRVARCLAFGLRFNGSATCIAPRRVFVPRSMQSALERNLCEQIPRHAEQAQPALSDRTNRMIDEAVRDGARVLSRTATTILTEASPQMTLLQSDVFEPVVCLVPVESTAMAMQAYRACPYALGAVVFGNDKQARDVAQRIDAGCVVINDMIAPTADPRVPFTGRKRSGFGSTRGAAGLLEMTQPKAIVHQRSNWLPHLDETTPHDADLLRGLLRVSHGGDWRSRLQGLWTMIQAVIEQRRWTKEQQSQRRPGHVR